MKIIEALLILQNRNKFAPSRRVRMHTGIMRPGRNVFYTFDDSMPRVGVVLDAVVLDPKKQFERYPTVEDLLADDWEIVYVRVQCERKVTVNVRNK